MPEIHFRTLSIPRNQLSTDFPGNLLRRSNTVKGNFDETQQQSYGATWIRFTGKELGQHRRYL